MCITLLTGILLLFKDCLTVYFTKKCRQYVYFPGNKTRMQASAIGPLYGKVLVKQTGRYLIGVIRI